MWVVARGASYAMPSLWAEVGDVLALGLSASGSAGLRAKVRDVLALGLRVFVGIKSCVIADARCGRAPGLRAVVGRRGRATHSR